MTLSQFLAMGGYGLYVWAAYGVAAVVMVANVLAARRRLRAVRRELGNLERLDSSEPE
jgi:heme exporter protein D